MTPTSSGVPGQVAPPDVTTVDGLLVAGGQILGLALLAGLLGALVAFAYRWYVREPIPEGIAILFGVAAVTVYVNAQGALGAVLRDDLRLLDPETAAFTLVSIGTAAILADVGRRIGDGVGEGSARVAVLRDIGEMGRVVRSGGRTVTVEVPGDPDWIADIDGHDPVGDRVKEDLAGSSFAFPRGVTVGELRERLADRLTEDYGIGHVDVELDADGSLTYLGIGRAAAGIGTTLPPGTAAVAVRADPPFSASPGDTVQVWTGGEEPERVATAEFRAGAGDVATLALDEADAGRLDGTTSYRLVTMPRLPAVEDEFAGLLRAADETMEAVEIDGSSTLVGAPVGALDVTVVAVRSSGGIEAIPPRSRVLAAADTVYVVAHPEDLRRFLAAAGPPANGGVDPAVDPA